MTMTSKFIRDGKVLLIWADLDAILPVGAQINNPSFKSSAGEADPKSRLRIIAVYYHLGRNTVEYTVDRVAP